MKNILKIFIRCFRYYRGYRLLYVANQIIRIMQIILNLIEPYLYASIITNLIILNTDIIWKNIFIIILIYFIKTILKAIISISDLHMNKNIAVNTKNKILQNILDIYPYGLNEFPDGNLISILYNDTVKICDFVKSISDRLVDILTIIIVGVIIIAINPLLTIVIIIIALLTYWVNYRYINILKKQNLEIYNKSDLFMGTVKTIVNYLIDIKINVGKEKMTKKFTDEVTEIKNLSIKKNKTKLKLNIISNSIDFGGQIIFILISTYLVIHDQLDVNLFISFYAYSKIFNTSLNRIAVTNANMQSLVVGIERIFSVINRYDEFCKEEKNKSELNIIKGDIQLRDINLTINKKEILNNVNLTTKPDTTTLITGVNGSGKTSIFNCISNVVEINNGSILLDNNNIRYCKYDGLYKNITYVTQNPILYPISIKDNLLFFDGGDKISFNKLVEICKAITIYDDIMKMPNKFETIISKNLNLSTGQTKKIQLARCILRDTKIVLMDEPLANLDQQFVDSFNKIIDMYFSKKTLIIITHQKNTIKKYDNLYNIAGGYISKLQ